MAVFVDVAILFFQAFKVLIDVALKIAPKDQFNKGHILKASFSLCCRLLSFRQL